MCDACRAMQSDTIRRHINEGEGIGGGILMHSGGWCTGV